jgi:hypothetical protein
MFETQYGKSLEEETFESWLEKGRESNMGYHYLLVIWNTLDEVYQSAFVATRDDLHYYQSHMAAQEVVVAMYDLYSESRITFDS